MKNAIKLLFTCLLFNNLEVAATNACNIDRLYRDGFSYSLPEKILAGFLSGKAFDNPEVYSADEAARLESDINDLYQRILAADPIKEKIAVITAGSPGAGKTVKLNQDLETNARQGRNYAYICPDDVCLKNQYRTYIADIQSGDQSKEVRQTAYNKWRPGSNAATHLILGSLIRENYAFYYGTTSSSPATWIFFDYLKKLGYRIRLIYVSAPDDVRWESIKERDKTFVQTTEQDVIEKGLLLPQRINDTFLKYADEIEFYYRAEVKRDAVLAARWLRDDKNGTLRILDQSAYDKLKAIHNDAIKVLNREELAWELTVESAKIL